ncbi:hypothetical protein CCZ01_00130 [Helicobacter monodelphidis]|nr:hypothetical protein CCZ01_00130 [Helicobacter sp. 15-1451]
MHFFSLLEHRFLSLQQHRNVMTILIFFNLCHKNKIQHYAPPPPYFLLKSIDRVDQVGFIENHTENFNDLFGCLF